MVYLLNVMFSSGIVARNLDSGTNFSAHCLKFTDFDSIISFTFGLTRLGNALFRSFSSSPDGGYIT